MAIDIEIELGTNLVSGPVYVNDAGPYRFRLDTGASTTTLTTRLADELGLSTYEGSRKEARGLGGGIPVKYARVNSLKLGELDTGHQEVYVLDLDNVMGRCEGRDGVLGYSTLRDYTLTLSYSEKRLELERSQGAERSTKGISDEWASFNYVQDTHLVSLPAIIDGSGPIDLVVDTGAGSTVFTPGLANRLKIDSFPVPGIARGVGGDVELRMARIRSIAVGSARIEEPQVAVVDLSRVSPKGELIENGILGYNFLSHFIMSLDYPNRLFRFRPTSPA
jgi:predicted aspartyl protease